MTQRNRIPAPAPVLLPDEMDTHAANEDHALRAVVLREHVMQRLWTGKTIFFDILLHNKCPTNTFVTLRTSAVN